MTPREELEQLRRDKRIKELEAKQAAAAPELELPTTTQAKQYAGKYLPPSGNVEDMDSGLKVDLALKSLLDRGYYGAKGLFTDLSDADKEQLEQGRAFTGKAGWAGFLGEEVGNAAATAAAAYPATRALEGVTALPLLWKALTQGGARVAAGTGTGALMSPQDRKAGAAGGFLGSLAGEGTGALAHGVLGNFMQPEARALIQGSEGRVLPTVGQALGGRVGQLEEKFSSNPLLGGGSITQARNRGVDQWSAEALHRVLPPHWRMNLPNRGIGDEAVFAVGDRISDMYRDALSRFPPQFAVDPAQLAAAGAQAARRGDLALSEQAQARVNLWVQQNLVERAHSLSPEVAKRIESDLGKAIQNLRSSQFGEDRAIGTALGDVQQAWRGSLTALGDAGGEGAGQALRQADASYRAFLPIDAAAAKRVSQNAETPGRFSPRTLRQGFEQVDQSKNNRASRRVAAGVEPYQPPAGPGAGAAAVEPEPVITRGPQTPMSSSTDLATRPNSFQQGGGARQLESGQPGLPYEGGGQLGPVRSEVGRPGAPGEPPGARRPPLRPDAGGAAPDAPGGIYAPYDDINLLTRQGEAVMPNRVPDSGTAGRAGLMALPAALGAMYKVGGTPGVMAGVGAGALAHAGSSEWVQRMLLTGNRGAQGFNDWLLGPALRGTGVTAGGRAGAPPTADERREEELKRQLRLQGLVE